MKYTLLALLLLLASIITNFACPLCVGRVTKQSQPFFAPDFYKPYSATKQSEKSAPTTTDNKGKS